MSAGHTRADIMGYTLQQVADYMGAIERRHRDIMIGEAISVRMAQAEGKAWKRYINDLTRG